MTSFVRTHFLPLLLLILALALGTSALAQTTVTLRDGLNGYTGTRDNDALQSLPDTNRGSVNNWSLNWSTGIGMIRFAIFAREGGPIPDDATITSATLSVYQNNGPGSTWEARRLLKNWQEMQATWNVAATGLPWQTAGAQGATDVAATADSQTTMSTIPGWLSFDVTAGVQAFASGTANYGWRIGWVTGTTGPKTFWTRENTNASLRPTLTVTYTKNPPPNISLRDGLNGYTGTRDNDMLQSLPDAQRGSLNNWSLNWSTGAGLIKFAIFVSEGGPVPDGATITSATLSVYQNDGPGSTWEARQVLKNWQEMESTWNIAASGLPWETAGAKGATDVASTADDQRSMGNIPGWLKFDVTSSVQAFATGSPNYGWRIGWVSGTTGAKSFWTREIGDPSVRPMLSINYGAPTAPTAHLSATPTSGHPPLSVTFDASSSSDGGSTITSLRLQYGDGQEVTWTDKNQTQSHIYSAAGFYTATLIVTNAAGTSAPSSKSISVDSSVPTARLTADPTSGQSPLNVTFDASSSTDGSSSITSLRLQFGDGQEATWSDKFQTQSHTYTGNDTYTATLTATNSFGTSTPTTTTVSVGGDNCSIPGLALCLRFEPAPDTRFMVPDSHQVSMTSVGGATVVARAHNKNGGGDPTPGDSADPNGPNARLSLVNFGRDGGSAIRFTTLDDDDCVHSGKKDCPDSSNTEFERSELRFPEGNTGGSQGAEQWWSHSVFLPANVPNVPDFRMQGEQDTWKESWFLQFHSGAGRLFTIGLFNQPGPNPHRVFRARQDGPGGANQYSYRVADYGIPPNNTISGQCLHDNPVPNVWYDFVHHVKYSANGDGFHRIWMRQGDGQVKKVMDKQSINTLRSTTSPAYLKIGTYHNYLSGNSSVIHDRLRRGNSFDAVRIPGFDLPPSSEGVILCDGVTLP